LAQIFLINKNVPTKNCVNFFDNPKFKKRQLLLFPCHNANVFCAKVIYVNRRLTQF